MVKMDQTVTQPKKSFHGPKTYPITCIGVTKTDENGKTETTFAEGHKKIRLVYAADQKVVKRCEKCQEAFAKIRGRKGANPKKALTKVIEEAKRAQMLLKSEMVADMSTNDVAMLEEYVRLGEDAVIKLEELEEAEA